jgi:hypothetical protein
MRLLPRELETLWTLFTAPVVWALHFLLCYLTVAIHCAKVDPGASLAAIRFMLAGATVLALATIVLSATLAWRQWGFGLQEPPHEEPTREDRRLFQGFATLLLSALSFVSVLFVALPLAAIERCVS